MRRLLVALVGTALILAAGCDRATAPQIVPEVAPSTSAPPPPKTRLTVAAAGDLLVHPPLTEQAAEDARAAGHTGHDFTQVLAPIASVVSIADLAICHMETPLALPAGPFTGFPIFSVPPELADAAAQAGFDTCSTASNHSLDTGMDGVRRTLDNLDRVGLRHTGTARDADEARTPNIIDVSGVKVAQLSYTFSFNGIPLPEGKPWAANLIDDKAILAEARQARTQGAEIVILSLQWGTEYQNAADDGQIGLAQQLLAGPEIDLIVGHHVHVVQPFEKIGRKWVAYGLGNLTTRFPDGSPENTQDAVVATFTFSRVAPDRWEVTEVSAVPTFMAYYPAARVVNLPAALADRRLPPESRADFARIHRRIAGYLDMRGARSAGLTVAE